MKIRFLDKNLNPYTEATIQEQHPLIDICYKERLPINFSCRIGMCGTCIINVVRGQDNISPLSEAEQFFNLEPNERLACQCIIQGDVDIG